MHTLTHALPVLAVVLPLFASARTATAQDKIHPVVAAVKADLKDPTKPFTILVQIKVKDGAGSKLEAAFAKATVPTRKEKGNQAYDLIQYTKKPNEYVVYERWADLAALEAHLNAAYITALLAEVADLLDGPPEGKVFVPAGR